MNCYLILRSKAAADQELKDTVENKDTQQSPNKDDSKISEGNISTSESEK